VPAKHYTTIAVGFSQMCLSGAMYLSEDCCFSQLALYKSNSDCCIRYKIDTIKISTKCNLISP